MQTLSITQNTNVNYRIKDFMQRKAQQYPDLDLDQPQAAAELERTW